MATLSLGGWLVSAALLMLLILQRKNLERFDDPAEQDAGPPQPRPRVSVLIPARNEERSIRECVRSILEQTFDGETEVVVLDDESSDQTAAIVKQLSAIHPNLTLLQGRPLPAGWRGKVWACHQLASQATGDVLLFTDADTTHEPQCLEASIRFLERDKLDLLSLMPRQVAVTFAERLTVPLLNFFYLTFFPSFMLERGFDPRFAAANGQFLLVRRLAYEVAGGHEGIRDSVVDDLDLARQMRRHRMAIRTADGARLVSCRMYRSWPEIVEGFTKNLFPALGGSPIRTAWIVAMLIALFVAPPIALIVSRDLSWLIATLLGLWLRARTASRSLERPVMTLLHPISIALSIALLLRSMLAYRTSMGTTWKGRRV